MKILNKNLLTIVALSSATGLMIAGGAVFAAASDPLNSTSNTATSQQNLLAQMQSKGTAEINRRITSLNAAASKISSATKLTSSDKSYLQTEVSGEISGLTSLETTLNAETTVTAARTDVQNIFSEYRVYALILPKLRLVVAADGEQATAAKLSSFSPQLQTRITADQTAGKDVTTLQDKLNDMDSQTANAQSLANAIETKVLTLQPSDYDSDSTILSGDVTQLKTAHSDNQAAYSDAENVVSGLKALE